MLTEDAGKRGVILEGVGLAIGIQRGNWGKESPGSP